MNKIKLQVERRVKRTRSKIFGTEKRPRLSVFRSNRFIDAQLINDEKGQTLCAVSGKALSGDKKIKGVENAKIVGEKIAELALKKGIKDVIFDRRGYKYHGQVKALADGARCKGLIF